MKAIACAIMVVAGALPLPPDTSLTMHTFADVWVFHLGCSYRAHAMP
jgi:hypothetical protein